MSFEFLSTVSIPKINHVSTYKKYLDAAESLRIAASSMPKSHPNRESSLDAVSEFYGNIVHASYPRTYDFWS